MDNRLLHRDSAAAGERALKLLTSRHIAITIELDLNYGDLRAMQHHPDAGWLRKNGCSEKLAKRVHIPEVEDFLSP